MSIDRTHEREAIVAGARWDKVCYIVATVPVDRAKRELARVCPLVDTDLKGRIDALNGLGWFAGGAHDAGGRRVFLPLDRRLNIPPDRHIQFAVGQRATIV